jgi:hypothetical protein
MVGPVGPGLELEPLVLLVESVSFDTFLPRKESKWLEISNAQTHSTTREWASQDSRMSLAQNQTDQTVPIS